MIINNLDNLTKRVITLKSTAAIALSKLNICLGKLELKTCCYILLDINPLKTLRLSHTDVKIYFYADDTQLAIHAIERLGLHVDH